MNNAPERVAAAVRAAMSDRSVTQLEVSAATGIAQPTLSRRLAGHTPFDVGELDRIAAFLGVKASSFLEVAA